MEWTGVGPFSDLCSGLALVRLVTVMEWTGVGPFSDLWSGLVLVRLVTYGVDWGCSV